MLNKLQKQIVLNLQEDLPMTSNPFEEIAKRIGISEENLIKEIRILKEKGCLKRMGAVLAHRKLGLNYNPMIIMEVKPGKIDETGKKVAENPEVTHCYNRPRKDDFPYDLYAMIHCESKEDAEEKAKNIVDDENITNHQLLYSTKEYKKTSMKYFKENEEV